MDRGENRWTLENRLTLILAVAVWSMGTQASWSQTPTQPKRGVSLQDGYLFLDGEYIKPPYEIDALGDEIHINDRVLDKQYLGKYLANLNDGTRSLGRFRSDDRAATTGMGMRRRWNGKRTFNPLSRMADEIDGVSLGAIVVVYENHRPLTLFPERNGYEFLAALSNQDEAAAPENLSSDEKYLWEKMTTDFQPTKEFVSRVRADLDEVQATSADGDRTIAANLLATKYSYPMTVIAMVIVVLGFGHLLSNQPMRDPQEGDLAKRHVIVKSLIIIVLLSAIDLIWTIAAAHSGAMRELNPLGSQWVDDPVRLTAFKFAVVGISITILYVLHRRPVAQVASWWCCLLLTLLTARWVVFQSMFL